MLGKRKTIRYAVLADTHVPDRVKNLPTKLLHRLEHANVDRILHAGDASTWQVVHTLQRIAPVTIVQGNRDWFFRLQTSRHHTLNIHGVRITVAHGHRSMLYYLVDKWAYIRKGYRFKRYYDQLAGDYPDSDVIIFGHTHHQTVKWVKDQLFFNPGAAYPCKYNDFVPQFGILSITPEGVIRTECHKLL